MPDEIIAWNPNLADQTIRLLNNADRLLYQYAELKAMELRGRYTHAGDFIAKYQPGKKERTHMMEWLREHGMDIRDEPFVADWEFIANRLASEIAGLMWDREEQIRVRLEADKQVQAALNMFNLAEELLAAR